MPTPNPEKPTPNREAGPGITESVSTHPVGTGVGAIAGGATGAALGSVGGPIGTAVGAVLGAVAGGFVGKEAAASVDPAAEDDYWRKHHEEQKHAGSARPYEQYAPVYRVGYLGYREGETFEDREDDLRVAYEAEVQSPEYEVTRSAAEVPEENTPGTMQYNMTTYALRWEDAREAARAAYERVRRGEAARRPAS